MTKISRQKIQAIVRKDFANSDFYVEDWFSVGEKGVKVSLSFGKNRDPEQEYFNMLILGERISSIGGDVRVYSNEHNVSLIVNNSGEDIAYDRFEANSFMEKYCAEKISSILERLRIEKERKDEKEREYEERMNKKLAKALEMNPHVQFSLLEGEIGSRGIGFAKMLGIQGNQYILFTFECYQSWKDQSYRYSLDIHNSGVKWNRDAISYGGGSTSITEADTIEDGLLEYIAYWHVS